jgi:TonB-linked SusC/RagA family outer membrane protein
MTRELQRWIGASAVAAALAAAPCALVAQDATGSITGRVTDRASGRPVVAAQVQVIGLAGRGAVTNDQGAFRLAGLPLGTYRVRVLRIGYEAQVQPVTVTAGAAATLDVALPTTAVSLDQVVVTATGEQVRRREQGNTTASITPDAQALAATANVSEVLNSRTPGVYVQQSSGGTGTGSRIRIRGANSLSLNNEPLLVVDGVRANSDVGNRMVVGGGTGTNVGTGGQTISRLNDINAEDIESIEIVKGPAGVALYGTAAANGVIQITTKRGRAGRSQFNVFGEAGALRQDVELPGNYGNVGRGSNGAPTLCTNEARARGACTQGTLRVLHPVRVDDPFRAGARQSAGVNAGGGNDRLTYFASGDFQQERGVQLTNDDYRYNLRGNFGAELRPGWTLQVNSGYLRDRAQLPVNDNSTLGLLSVALLGRVSDSLSGGFYNGYTPTQLEALSVRNATDRFTTSATSQLGVNRFLSFSGVAGLDFTGQRFHQVVRPNRVAFGDLPQGSANSNPLNTYFYTAQGTANLNVTLPGEWTSTTQVGAQYARELDRGTSAAGAQLAAGSGSLSGTTARFAVGEFNRDNVLVGVLGLQRFAWRDRLFLNAGLRADRNSAAGRNFGLVYQPSANVSYVVSDEGFFPANPVLTSLRLIAAYGQSTQRPRFTDALTFLQPFAVRADGAETAAISFAGGSIGDPNLRPEVSAEVEGGLEAGFLRDRVVATVNYYHKTTRDLLIAAPVAPSVGAATARFQNLGRMRNRGWEFQLTATPLDTRPVKLEVTAGGSTLDNRLLSTDLPSPIQVNTQQQHRPGYPAGAFFQRRYTYSDANGDGIIARSEIAFPAGGADTAVYLGNPLPGRELQGGPTLTLFQNFRASALVSHRGRFKVNNATNRFRCAFAQNCRDVHDPTAPLDLQARAVAAAAFSTDAGYIEDGSFTRLREVAFTYTVPGAALRRSVGSRIAGATLTVAGRNLVTWTNYTGLDPEITSTPGANFSSSEFLTVPPTRQWIARVGLTF